MHGKIWPSLKENNPFHNQEGCLAWIKKGLKAINKPNAIISPIIPPCSGSQDRGSPSQYHRGITRTLISDFPSASTGRRLLHHGTSACSSPSYAPVYQTTIGRPCGCTSSNYFSGSAFLPMNHQFDSAISFPKKNEYRDIVPADENLHSSMIDARWDAKYPYCLSPNYSDSPLANSKQPFTARFPAQNRLLSMYVIFIILLPFSYMSLKTVLSEPVILFFSRNGSPHQCRLQPNLPVFMSRNLLPVLHVDSIWSPSNSTW